MFLDIPHEVLNELPRLLPADTLFFRIAIARVTKVGSVEG
jgi:hypothetical protein